MKPLFDDLDDADRALLRPASAAFVAPMLATLTEDRFTDPAWIFERKLDGVRAISVRRDTGASLWSRTEKPMDATYPELVDAVAAQIPADTVVDGEIVAFVGAQTSFERLQGRIGMHDPVAARATGIPVFLYLFDLLVLDGHDTTALPLRVRKRLLRDAVDFTDPLRMSSHRNGDGEAYLQRGLPARLGGVGRQTGRRALPARPPLRRLAQAQVRARAGARGRRVDRSAPFPHRVRRSARRLPRTWEWGRRPALRGQGRHRLRPRHARSPQRPLPRPRCRPLAVRRDRAGEGRALAAARSSWRRSDSASGPATASCATPATSGSATTRHPRTSYARSRRNGSDRTSPRTPP